MNYEPIQAAKSYLLASFVIQDGVSADFRLGNATAEAIATADPDTRSFFIMALLCRKYLGECNNILAQIHRLEDVDEGQAESWQIPEQVKKINETLDYLKTVWPYEYAFSVKAIPDIEAALMCMSRQINNQAVSAFCPEGSRGFIRSIETTGVENPAAPRPVPQKQAPDLFEMLFGVPHPYLQNQSQPSKIKEIEFPES